MEGRDAPEPGETLLLREVEPPTVVRLYSIHLTLAAFVLALFVGSAIICATDDACRNHIPTVANMLNSTLSAPFVVTGFNAALLIHALVVVGIVVIASRFAPHWAALQMLVAFFVYGTLMVTLFVLPFTGWPNNWANVAVLAAIGLWLIVSQVALFRGKRNGPQRPVSQPHWPLLVTTIVYWLCLVPYIVVRAVPTLPVPNKDIGLLVCQVVGGTSLALYLGVCFVRVSRVGVRFYHPEAKVD